MLLLPLQPLICPYLDQTASWSGQRNTETGSKSLSPGRHRHLLVLHQHALNQAHSFSVGCSCLLQLLEFFYATLIISCLLLLWMFLYFSVDLCIFYFWLHLCWELTPLQVKSSEGRLTQLCRKLEPGILWRKDDIWKKIQIDSNEFVFYCLYTTCMPTGIALH